MKLEVIRFNKGKDSTNGILFDISNRERKFLCYTLEDESRTKKVPGETCIPEGEYCLGFRTVGGFDAKYAHRFADIHMGMLEVLNVSDFKYIKENGFIGKSTHAYYRVYQEIAEAVEKKEEVTITYRDFASCLILSQTEVSEFFDQC